MNDGWPSRVACARRTCTSVLLVWSVWLTCTCIAHVITRSTVRFGYPEQVDIYSPPGEDTAGGAKRLRQPAHFWFPSNGAAVGTNSRCLVLPIRLTCDNPCYNASTDARDVVVWRSSRAAFPLPPAVPASSGRPSQANSSMSWSIAEQLPAPTGHSVPWFMSSFRGSGADTGVLTTVQPHRAAPSGPAAISFVGHATRWTVNGNGTAILKATVARNVTYSVSWTNISSLDGSGQIGRLQHGNLIQSVNFNTVGNLAMGVAAFGSKDGLLWHWLNVAALPDDLPHPTIGASETAIAVLMDGSVLIVIRTGNGFHAHEPLYATRSSAASAGRVWSKPAAMEAQVSGSSRPWGVKPTLLQIPSGPLLLTTGRPGLFLWVSFDNGSSWTANNIAAAHNAALRPSDPGRFSSKCVLAAQVQGPGEAETTAYTSLVASVHGADAVVCYDRLAHGWFGPSRNQIDRVYCIPVWIRSP